MRVKTVRALSILLLLVLSALPLTAAPSPDGAQAPTARSWTSRVLVDLHGWLSALFPDAGANAEGAERMSAADGLVLDGEPDGATTDCTACTEDGGGSADGNGGPDIDPNGTP